MSSEIIRQQILAALKKLGPAAPRAITDEVGVDQSIVSYHLRELVKAKALKASGTTSARVYALPEQKLEATKGAPQRRKKSKGNGRRAKPKPRAPRAQPTAPLFLPAITEDWRLVIVQQDGVHAVFTPEQTQAIADLLLTHFEAS